MPELRVRNAAGAEPGEGTQEMERTMEISDEAAEVLEQVWIRTEEDGEGSVDLTSLGLADGSVQVEELSDIGAISLSEGRLSLTELGEQEGRDIVRRHRLSERLLADVLDVKGILLDESACRFEHILHKGIDEKVCTLLGHPKTCPHGKSIPQGPCCLDDRRSVERAVSPLSSLSPGERGSIAYVLSQSSETLQKLMAMGVLPGMSIELIRRFPSYVFQVGNTQFAVDTSVADEVYVRIEG